MPAETMKAIQQHAFGGPEVLVYEDAPLPELKPGEVRVRVHAVGLNPPDFHLREGYKALPPEWRPQVDFPMILGTDVSGVVEAVADDVKTFAVGDEVYSMVRFPTGMMGAPGPIPNTSACPPPNWRSSGQGRSRSGRRRADVAADRLAVPGRARSR